jgi:hypothetical protein
MTLSIAHRRKSQKAMLFRRSEVVATVYLVSISENQWFERPVKNFHPPLFLRAPQLIQHTNEFLLAISHFLFLSAASDRDTERPVTSLHKNFEDLLN